MMKVKTVIDHLGQSVTFQFPPRRIISLVPSQTELLFSLGLNDQVVGVTKFCIHPQPLVGSKAVVGGTKTFDFDKIDHLHPDVIIGNKEENYREGIEQLRKKYPVWMSDIYSLDDALRTIVDIGNITGAQYKARSLRGEIQEQFSHLPRRMPASVLYLIWRKPWMAAGKNTFIDDMISRNGWINVLNQTRYPELRERDIVGMKPDLIFASSEPYPFAEKHRAELHLLCPNAKFILVDGEMFSWYGSRLIYACEYFKSLKFS
jgi:ABC-type Fe3+-hydroxamate transport system substrate-binding protein